MEGHHVQQAAATDQTAGYEIRTSSQEDAEAKDTGEATEKK